MTKGRVYIVGAGPGAPGLLTVRGAELLSQADIVLYDYLANDELLSFCRPDCRKICIGSHSAGKVWNQEEINQGLVRFANQHQTVVRLKGGDPSVFACVGQEVEALSKAGIEFEIVPGITAALAAAAYTGIPLTHRDCASAVALVTGHESEGKESLAVDYGQLSRFPGTIVIYMGTTTVAEWSQQLLENGKSESTPVAIIRRCSWPDQKVTHTTLGEVARVVLTPPKIRPPVIFVIGEVSRHQSAFDWQSRLALAGQTILITRPEDQSTELKTRFATLGAEVLSQPTIRISHPTSWTEVDQTIEKLDQFDWVVFSSANGVRSYCQRILTLDRDARAFKSSKIAVVGSSTAKALSEFSLKADFVPSSFEGEAFANELAPLARERRVLIVRTNRGRDVIQQILSQNRASVSTVVAYESSDVEVAEEVIRQRLESQSIDWITVSSSSIAKSLVRLFGEELRKSKLVSISPITSATLRDLGFPPAAEATTYTMAGLAEAILLCQLDQSR